MASFFKRLAGAARATVSSQGEGRFQARGEFVICPICGGKDFVMAPDRRVKRPLYMKLNLPSFELDRFASSLICTHCTHMLSFGRPPERLDDDL